MFCQDAPHRTEGKGMWQGGATTSSHAAEATEQADRPWALRGSYWCLPGSLHPERLGHTSAPIAPDLGTGFGDHSSKGLPFSDMLQNTNHAVTYQVVLFPGVSNSSPIG